MHNLLQYVMFWVVTSLLLDPLSFCRQFSLPAKVCLLNVFQVGVLGCIQSGLAYSSLCTHVLCTVIVLVHLGANPFDCDAMPDDV